MQLNEKQIKTFNFTLSLLKRLFDDNDEISVLASKEKAFIVLKLSEDHIISFEAQPFRGDESALVVRSIFATNLDPCPKLIKIVSDINAELFFGSMNLLITEDDNSLMYKYSVLASHISEEYITAIIREVIIYIEKYSVKLFDYGVSPSNISRKILNDIAKKN